MRFGPLPPLYAEAIALSRRGMSGRDISLEIGVSESTARERVRRAKLHERGLREAPSPDRIPRSVPFERGDLTPCQRCGLRGAHECTPSRAEGYLRSQQD